MLAARGLNIGLQIGKCFGFPLPSIDGKNFSDATDFLNRVGESTLDDYDYLQDLVKQHWGHNNNNNNNNNNNTSLSVNSNDFSIHEFETFLSQCDPTHTHSSLLQCVYKEEGQQRGDKIYICKQCCDLKK